MKKTSKSLLGVIIMMSMLLSGCVAQQSDVVESKTETGSETLSETLSETISETSSETLSEAVSENVSETQTDAENGTEVSTEKETAAEFVYEPDVGEGYEHILLDRRFDLGFGCEWTLGKTYTLNTGLKQGNVIYYQDIGKPFYVLPLGLATQGTASNGLIASSGLEDKVYWQFEEGAKKHFVDATGAGPYELQDHRIAVNSVVKQNDKDRLLIEQYNDYLHETYPDKYPESNPLLVKKIDSNRNGKIVFSYNSYNDISNTAYAYSSQFAEDTWPHLLLHQSFAEPVDLAKYSSIEFSMTVKVNRADQINSWPQGSSDRYDQPAPPSGASVSPSETTLQTYFFIRSKKAPYTLGAFVGIMLSSSNESLNREHLGIEQNGIDFYRINLGNKEGKKFGLEGEWLKVGDETTVKVDLIKYLEYVLEYKFDNKNPNSKWYGVGVDDVYMSFFNLGYEYIGNWDCEYELSNICARGILDTEVENDDAYDGKWHVSVDELIYSESSDFSDKSQITVASTNNVNGTVISNWAGSYSKITAKYLQLTMGWIAVDGCELENFACRIYSADGSLLKTVSCGLYGVETGVVDHVTNNLGYSAETSPHRFNGNPNVIDLSEYSGQTVKVVYEVDLVDRDKTVKLIEIDVTVQ